MRRIVLVFALAAGAANAAGVSSAKFGDIGLEETVVTNVNLMGLVESPYVDAKVAEATNGLPEKIAGATNDLPALLSSTLAAATGYTDAATNRVVRADTNDNIVVGFGTNYRAEGYGNVVFGSDAQADGFFNMSIGVNTVAEGEYAFAKDYNTHAEGFFAHAEGSFTHAKGSYAHAAGIGSEATNNTAFVWQGFNGNPVINTTPRYGSHGDGTYNLNPVGGLAGLWIGETNMADHIAAAIGTNNPAFVAAVTNCPVVIAAADGTTLGEFGEYGTLGALLATLAAAITWLKTNKADAAALPYALVTVAPTAGAPFVLAACFPIKYEDANTSVAHTVQLTDISHITVALNETSGKYEMFDSGFSEIYPICLLNADGTYYSDSDDASEITFGANDTPPTQGETQVLGFAQTAPLADRAINAVSLTTDATLVFPAQTAGKARDFVVRLTLTETDNVVPSVTFPADVAYETEGGEWPDLTEAGTYIVRLTEVPKASESETARFFLQCSSAVADAEPPSAGGGQ